MSEPFSWASRFLNDASREAVVLAQQEAFAIGRYIGPGHLLVGLLRQNGGAANILTSLGFTTGSTSLEVARLVGEGSENPAGLFKFTPAARGVLEAAFFESRSRAHSRIRTTDLLLGLLRVNDGPAARLLAPHAEEIRRQVDRLSGRIAASEEEELLKSGSVSEEQRSAAADLRALLMPLDEVLGRKRRRLALRKPPGIGLTEREWRALEGLLGDRDDTAAKSQWHRLALMHARGVELTEREWEVVERLYQGVTTRQIAEELEVHEVTVRRHISRVLHKAGVRTRSELFALLDDPGIE